MILEGLSSLNDSVIKKRTLSCSSDHNETNFLLSCLHVVAQEQRFESDKSHCLGFILLFQNLALGIIPLRTNPTWCFTSFHFEISADGSGLTMVQLDLRTDPIQQFPGFFRDAERNNLCYFDGWKQFCIWRPLMAPDLHRGLSSLWKACWRAMKSWFAVCPPSLWSSSRQLGLAGKSHRAPAAGIPSPDLQRAVLLLLQGSQSQVRL